MNDGETYHFIEVRYRNGNEGFVDDVTLNELIVSKRIRQFYRPLEQRWSMSTLVPPGGCERIPGFRNEEHPRRMPQEKKERPRGLLGGLFRRRKHVVPRPLISAREWFARGLVAVAQQW